jgi:hypothetical protein
MVPVAGCASISGNSAQSPTGSAPSSPGSASSSPGPAKRPALGGTAVARTGDLLVFRIGGQCDARSVLHDLRVVRDGTVLWDIQGSGGPTPFVTLGQVPGGFVEVVNRLPDQPLLSGFDLVYRTSFWFSAPVGLIADGAEMSLDPQPILSERTHVRPLNC